MFKREFLDPEDWWADWDRRVELARDVYPVPTRNPKSAIPNNLMMLKRYVETVVCQCSEERFGQDAVEWAILSGHITLTYNLQADLRAIMGEPGQPDTGQYSQIITAYQAEVAKNTELLEASYEPLLTQLPTPALKAA